MCRDRRGERNRVVVAGVVLAILIHEEGPRELLPHTLRRDDVQRAESEGLNWQCGSLSAKIPVCCRTRGVFCTFLNKCDRNTKSGVTIGQHGAHLINFRGMELAAKQQPEVERQDCPRAMVIHHRFVLMARPQMQALHIVR